MRLQDIMTHPVETVAAGESADVAYTRMKLQGIRHLVVVADGAVVGILSERDVGGARGAALRRGRAVADLMAPHVVSGRPAMTVREAANLLRGHSIGCLPVVEGRKLRGIVTVSDLLELLGRGAERPVVIGKRWTLKHRGPGRASRKRLDSERPGRSSPPPTR